MRRRDGRLSAGLFLTTFATLVLEILDARLLSVLTWYHLSFFAVSLAMLGMAAGAVAVFLRGPRAGTDEPSRALARAAAAFAVSIPATHVLNLCIPFPALTDFSVMEVTAIVV
ncbi:MAG: hypothetical protein LC804_12380, partial [Acidobacteria bacterium]|nr:hypothetical protein [Acidobacteriota bacterium]